MPLATWCAVTINEIGCRSQIACGIADPDAGCANIQANSRLARAEDPCSPALLAALDAGTVHYDDRAAARCLQDQQTQCQFTVAACTAVIAGEGAERTPCNFDQQCAPELWCSFSAGVCPGACEARVAVGDVTTVPSACATRLVQSLDGGSFRCVEFQGLAQPCGDGLFCSVGLHCEEGSCAVDREVGAACNDSQRCLPGASCVSGRCVRFAKRGEPCASQFFPTNPGANSCQLGLACRSGRCGDALRAGESCREEPNRCGEDSRCDLETDLCKRLATAGTACTNTFECSPPLLCGGGTCRAPAALGEACDATTRCEPIALCRDGRCVSSARECR